MMVIISYLLFLIFASFLFDFWMIIFSLFILGGLFFIKFGLGFFVFMSQGLGMDFLSYSLSCLSIWICLLMVLASAMLYQDKFYFSLFGFSLLVLLFTLIIAFCSLNLFVFYLFFEVSLVMTLVLILGWGGQPERISAGVYLLFYTLVVSLPMMISMFFLYYGGGSLDYFFFNIVGGNFLYFCVNLVFFVKIPMYFIHLWLPKAHVEAPISGSMILAGVMLKLGGYGLMRTMKIFLNISYLNLLFIVISILGGVYISMVCLRQSDLKMLIAYSSVSHMGMVMAGILTLNIWGYLGGMILMLAHGLSSSGLFCLANLVYERTHSRSLYLNGGFINIMPSVSLWWFLLCSSNMAAPPSLNLMGEIILICSLSIYSKMLVLCMFFLVFYSAAYSLFLYSYTQHGKLFVGLYSFYLVSMREYYLVFLHWIPLNLLFLKSEGLVYWG
uniref:NADH-ubiquinone oxidoreductase chain 4 n=1 Tax=Pityophthorus pubescens TaxID=471227 RepID=A0A343A6H9_9CUCU|nr:NADH dehydrogenase subunit 4 [Pityophthorus pubescens]AOY40158.1 NADH dehydrogenase subunit 4 [Pityophthorus pubescens]